MSSISTPTNGSKFSLPPYVQQLLSLGVVLVSIVIFASSLKSDIRSNRESMERVFADIAVIKASLPNAEVTDMQINDIRDRIRKLEEELEFEAAKSQKFREELLSKGVLK